MSEDEPKRRRARRTMGIGVVLLALLLAIVIVPPYISVSRYRESITRLLSKSLGRPVRLSSVELRLFPRPGFVLTNLTVEEDPAYGTEPVLHANTVTASIRLLSLWRGLEISRISVDEASLNLVRTPAGRWNVESLFRTVASPEPAANGQPARRATPLPYLEATESRINVKNGTEKLPFSLVSTDLSLWQADPGEWRIRLRGQPARTDLSLDLADTGIVRLDADLHRAPELRQMPMHVDVEWREAQLGQLTRLLIGSDPGWRGNLTGEFHLDGTPDAAAIQTRLRASGVHRAEFAPATPMDFDATCKINYRYSARALEGLDCYSPVGDGRMHLAGGTKQDFSAPHLLFEVDRVPVEFGLDALRTMRSGFGPGLDAKGTISGALSYAGDAEPAAPVPVSAHKQRGAKASPAAPGPLTGSLTMQGFEISGDGLNQPIRINKVVMEPAPPTASQAGSLFGGLAATATIPAGAAAPLTVASRLGIAGYQVSVHGQASIARLRELARVAGIEGEDEVLGAVGGDSASIDLSADGPWLAPEENPFAPASAAAPAAAGPDRLSGTLTLRNASWKAEYLANPIQIAQGVLHLDGGEARWDGVDFAYGAIEGTASLKVPRHCEAPQSCAPQFQVQFGAMEADVLEAAILGAREKGTLLSSLIARISPSKTPAWPELEGTVKADSLMLGPVKLDKPSATLRIRQDGAEITRFTANMLGGHMEGGGTVRAAGASGNAAGKPVYALNAELRQLSPAAVGLLLGERWSGGELNGNGTVEVSGYTGEDFAGSASGSLHFEWRHGAVAPGAAKSAIAASGDSQENVIPEALTRFDRWTADATIAKGAITIGASAVARGAKQSTVAASMSFGKPARLTFAPAKPAESAQR